MCLGCVNVPKVQAYFDLYFLSFVECGYFFLVNFLPGVPEAAL